MSSLTLSSTRTPPALPLALSQLLAFSAPLSASVQAGPVSFIVRRFVDPLQFLESPSDYAFAQLEAANGDLKALPVPLQSLVLVYSAQGVIDNGGFQYFFESDWPSSPDYSIFSNAYRAIGATQVADAIDRAIRLFPFDEPHLNLELRNEFLSSLPENHLLFQLGDSICGNESVWLQLSDYVRQNIQVFRSA